MTVPIINPSNYVLMKDENHILHVLDNDFDLNNVAMYISSVGIAFAPVFIINNNTAVLYECLLTTSPYTDSFEYTIVDALGTTTTPYATLSIINAAPVAKNKTANVTKNSVDFIINLDYSGINQLDVHYIEIVKYPSHGSLTLVNDSSQTQVEYASQWFTVTQNTYLVLYTADHGFSATNYFEFSVTDTYDTNFGLVQIEIYTPPPVPADLIFSSVRNIATFFNLVEGNTDPVGDPLGVVPFTEMPTAQPGGYITFFNGSGVIYTPPPGFCGDDSLNFTIYNMDNSSLISSAFVTVEVHDAAPIAKAISTQCSRFYNITIDIMHYVSSPSNSPLYIDNVSSPGSDANVTNNSTAIFFQAAGSVPTTVAFSYIIADDLDYDDSSTITVDIYDIPPVAVDFNIIVLWNCTLTIDILPHDTDVYNATLSIYSNFSRSSQYP